MRRWPWRLSWPPKSHTASPNDSIAVSRATVSLLVGGRQQLSVDATYSDGSHKDVTASTTWADSNQAVAKIDNTGVVSGLFAGTAAITANDGSFSASATVTVTGANIPIWHGDNQRSGLNPNEGILTTANVTPQSFGKLFSYFVDDYIYAQPLYVSNLTINRSAHNVVFAVTQNDSAYAFDVDQPGSSVLLCKRTTYSRRVYRNQHC